MLIVAFAVITLFTRLVESSSLHILGFTSTISVDEVVSHTNEERLSYGLQPLKLSTKLSHAAAAKAADMFQDNYWAHNSPDGQSPWDFIINADYNYEYAGENLAKDFSNTPRLMQAWMASPTHKANIISDKYNDIGIAIVPGVLNGTETVLVVQMFGNIPFSPASGTIPISQGGSIEPEPEVAGLQEQAPVLIAQLEDTRVEETQEEYIDDPSITPITVNSRFDDFDFRRITSAAVLLLFMAVLFADLAIVESKKLSRRVGKNWAHLIFINVVLILISFASAGRILF